MTRLSAVMARIFFFLALLLVLPMFMRQAFGRLAWTLGTQPLRFLITRRTVLVGWGIASMGWGFIFIPTIKKHEPLPIAAAVVLTLFLGLGISAIVNVFGLAVVRAFAKAPVIELEPGERILGEERANHFLNGEARGGQLLVTTRRIAFRPHRINVQLDTWSIPLERITHTANEGSRLLVVFTPEPNYLVVQAPATTRAAIPSQGVVVSRAHVRVVSSIVDSSRRLRRHAQPST